MDCSCLLRNVNPYALEESWGNSLLFSTSFVSICGTFCQVIAWGQEVRSGGGICLGGRKSLWEVSLVKREIRVKIIFVHPRLNVLVIDAVKQQVKCIGILVCYCSFYPLYCRVLSAGKLTLFPVSSLQLLFIIMCLPTLRCRQWVLAQTIPTHSH